MNEIDRDREIKRNYYYRKQLKKGKIPNPKKESDYLTAYLLKNEKEKSDKMMSILNEAKRFQNEGLEEEIIKQKEEYIIEKNKMRTKIKMFIEILKEIENYI
jgi:predicted P-loop ATPase/GTPase